MALPKKLKKLNLFNDGYSYVGEVDNVVLPKLVMQGEDWRAGGMDAPIEIDMGMEKLEMEFTLGGYEKTIFRQFGLTNAAGILLRFAGSIEADDDSEVEAVEVVVRGRHKEIDVGEAKSGEDTAIKVVSALTYYKLTIGGETLIEIDVPNMIKIIDGTDLMAAHRTALGI